MFKRMFKRFKKTKKPKSATDHADYSVNEPEDAKEKEKRLLSDNITCLLRKKILGKHGCSIC